MSIRCSDCGKLIFSFSNQRCEYCERKRVDEEIRSAYRERIRPTTPVRATQSFTRRGGNVTTEVEDFGDVVVRTYDTVSYAASSHHSSAPSHSHHSCDSSYSSSDSSSSCSSD